MTEREGAGRNLADDWIECGRGKRHDQVASGCVEHQRCAPIGIHTYHFITNDQLPWRRHLRAKNEPLGSSVACTSGMRTEDVFNTMFSGAMVVMLK